MLAVGGKGHTPNGIRHADFRAPGQLLASVSPKTREPAHWLRNRGLLTFNPFQWAKRRKTDIITETAGRFQHCRPFDCDEHFTGLLPTHPHYRRFLQSRPAASDKP